RRYHPGGGWDILRAHPLEYQEPGFARRRSGRQSIIDGGGAGACLQLKNLLSTAPIQLIQGFTIQNGNDPGTQLFSDRTGGGLFIQFGSPVVNHCIFTGNQGGGIYIFESSPTLNHCIVAGNQGGGIFSVDGSPIVNN